MWSPFGSLQDLRIAHSTYWHFEETWSNITRLEARIDLDEGRILEYDASVWGPDDEQPVFGSFNPFGLIRVYDARTDEHLITGLKIFILPRPILCTPGRYYRD